MSGVEVAGLILGAFPLTISALEHYRETAETLGIFWKIRRSYKTWIHGLNICKLAFEQNLEEFLLPLIADEEELQQLIAEPHGPAWKNPELEKRLRQRLPKSYDLYLESIERIQDVMIDLKSELGMDKAGFQSKVSEEDQTALSPKTTKNSIDTYVSKANFEFQTQRIKMSFNQSKRDKLFEDLTDYNNELRTLLDTSDRIAALRRSRDVGKKSAVSKGMWQFWRHADRLYNLLTQSWACDCKIFHQANLLLQHRTTSNADFRIMFVYAQQNLRPKPWSWTCQETTIKLLEEDWQPKNSVVSFTTTITPIASNESLPPKIPPSISTTTTPTPKKSSFRKSFMGKFKKDKTTNNSSATLSPQLTHTPQISPVPSIVTTPASTPKVTFTDTSDPISRQNEINMVDVSNLCDTIAAYPANMQQSYCLKGEEARFALQPLGNHSATDIQDTVSLEQLLSKDSKITLTRRERYLIALTLASSHLQLHATPWISSQWEKGDIFFLRSHDQICFDKPYISRNFAPNPPTDSSSHDRSLSNLGIMLLELCFGTALEDHELRKKYPSDSTSNPFLDMAAALEWSPRAVEEAGPEFADAILWCLHNMPGSGESDSKLEKRREELFVKVVEPLKYCCDQFNTSRS